MPIVTPNKSAIFLGIESGATGSVAHLANARGRVLATRRAGPLGSDGKTLASLLTPLFRDAGCKPQAISQAALCLAGLSLQGKQNGLPSFWAKRLAQCGVHALPRIFSDLTATLASELGHAPGMVVVAGTGSCLIAQDGDGHARRRGGWGSLLGDEGSGYALGREAIKILLSAQEGWNKHSPLTKALASRIKSRTSQQTIAWTHAAKKSDIAALAKIVFSAALRRDVHAEALLQSARQDLLPSILDLHAWLKQSGVAMPTIILAGGLFQHHPEHARAMRQLIRDHLGNIPVDDAKKPKGLGAVYIAMNNIRPSEIMNKPAPENDVPPKRRLDALSASEIIRLIQEEDLNVPRVLLSQRHALAKVADLMVRTIQAGGRIFYVGAGTSARLAALDAAELPPTFGVSGKLFQTIMAGGTRALSHAVEGAEDNAKDARHQVRRHEINAKDLLIGIAASGTTPFVLAAVQEARHLDAKTVGIACKINTPLQKVCDLCIVADTGPEIVAGSTRMKAGTATKLILNTLSTAAMIRLGKVFDHWMVDVQPSNDKLRARAMGIVRGITGVSEQKARKALTKADWNAKLAAVIAAKNVSVEQAKKQLSSAQGQLRAVLENTLP